MGNTLTCRIANMVMCANTDPSELLPSALPHSMACLIHQWCLQWGLAGSCPTLFLMISFSSAQQWLCICVLCQKLGLSADRERV